MKKLGSLFLGFVFLMSPVSVYAQTSDSLNATLIATLRQLVVILTQQLQTLLAQQSKATTANQIFITPSGTVVQENGTTISVPYRAYEEPTVYVPVPVSNTSQIKDSEDQIYQIRLKLDKDIADIKKLPIPVGDQSGLMRLYRDEANEKILRLQLQIGQLKSQ